MSKIRFFLIGILLLFAPVVRGQRMVQSLNDGWRFHKNDVKNVFNDPLNDSSWEKVQLPHTWNKKDAYETKNYYRGIAWYRKDVVLSPMLQHKKIYLKFDGALLSAKVYINGKLAGSHKGGYTAFQIDATSYLNDTANNVIAVKVDNSAQEIAPLSGDFTLWGGLYRNVWLITTPLVHFDMNNMGSNGVFISTPSVSREKGYADIRGAIQNDDNKTKKIVLVHTMLSPSGKLVSSKKQIINLTAKSKTDFNIESLVVNNPALWTPDSPSLYTSKITITDLSASTVMDEIVNHIGFRWYKFDAEKGFYLNGKPYKLLGVSKHQDQTGYGNALSNEQLRRDMQFIKSLGANFFRIAHYPQSDIIVEECDRLGILAWEEIPVVDMISVSPEFTKTTESQLREMIRQHYNHPSIIIWGYMNEVMLGTLRKIPQAQHNLYFKKTVELAQSLNAIIKQEDASRLTATAQHENVLAYDSIGLSSVPDILGWNLYQGWYGKKVADFGKFMDDQHAKHPQRVHMVSEYGAGTDRRLHSFQPICFDFSTEYAESYHEAMLPMIMNRPYIAGSVLWNMIDFGSANREETMPHINNKGIVYGDRTPKDIFYYYKANFNQEKMLHIATRDWPVRAGKQLQPNDSVVVQPVKVYSNFTDAALFINGQPLGTKKMQNRMAVWDVPFRKGPNLLEAKSVDKGVSCIDAASVNFLFQPDNLQQIPPNFELGVNVGSNCYFTEDASAYTWLPDQAYKKGSWGYIGGEVYTNNPDRIGIQTEITGTDNIPLYQTMRSGIEAYKFDLPDGQYEVSLGFADPGAAPEFIINDIGYNPNNTANINIFNILINDNEVLHDFNLLKMYGAATAVEKKFIIDAKNSSGITVGFKAVKGMTLLSTIKVKRNGY